MPAAHSRSCPTVRALWITKQIDEVENSGAFSPCRIHLVPLTEKWHDVHEKFGILNAVAARRCDESDALTTEADLLESYGRPEAEQDSAVVVRASVPTVGALHAQIAHESAHRMDLKQKGVQVGNVVELKDIASVQNREDFEGKSAA